jgi:ferredoxin
MKVWIDQEVCTGDGLCEEASPTVFQLEDGVSFVRDSRGGLVMGGGGADIPDSEFDAVLTAAEECPGECIFIEA